MTILALNLHLLGHFAIDVSITMRILAEMAVDAVHPFINVYIPKMYGLLEAAWISCRDQFAIFVEQITVTVALKNSAKVPAVTVIISKLRSLKLRIKLTNLFQEIEIAPQPSRCSIV